MITCQICGAKFSSYSALREPIRVVHSRGWSLLGRRLCLG